MADDDITPIEPTEPEEFMDNDAIEPDEIIPPVNPEISMDEKRRGEVLLADVLDSGHSRSVEGRSVENVMEDSYLRYSMSVIIARALHVGKWPG
jgi:hypothetical protein